MCAKEPDRKPSSHRRTAAALVACGLVAAAAPARAEGLWDALLEKMNVKAAPAAPGPDFVERTRPDPTGLSYVPTATPHKVSPLPVKTPAQIQAQKDALDAAKVRQLNPGAPQPLQIAKTAPSAADPAAPAKKRRGKGVKPAGAVAD